MRPTPRHGPLRARAADAKKAKCKQSPPEPAPPCVAKCKEQGQGGAAEQGGCAKAYGELGMELCGSTRKLPG